MKKRKNNGIFNYVVISLALLIVAGGAYAYSLNTTVNVEGDYNNYEATQNTPEEITLGAFPGPSMYAEEFCFNDVCLEHSSIPMRVATNTICAIQSPPTNSILDWATVSFDTATTADSIVHMAQHTSQFGTSTVIGTLYIEGGTTDYAVASSSRLNAGAFFAANQWFTVGMNAAGGISATVSPKGRCEAVFKKVN